MAQTGTFSTDTWVGAYILHTRISRKDPNGVTGVMSLLVLTELNNRAREELAVHDAEEFRREHQNPRTYNPKGTP